MQRFPIPAGRAPRFTRKSSGARLLEWKPRAMTEVEFVRFLEGFGVSSLSVDLTDAASFERAAS